MLQIKTFLIKHRDYLLSFFVPLLIMTGYFIARGMYPFGSSSLLTVDLGQQYIDFFSFFRYTLLHHPSSFLYSLSKAIGGDMLGVWAYYLMSPFNLIFLLTPGKWLTAGVFIITVLKYGTAGLTFAYLLKKLRWQKGWWVPIYSISYALIGYMTANQLNIMWLDAVIMLPLIVLGIEELFKPGHWVRYPLMLGALLIINYYMGYMVCLFVVLYFIWAISVHFKTIKQSLKVAGKFIITSILGGALAAIMLLPTAYALSISKAEYTEKWTTHNIFAFNPIEILSKFVVGAFNFDQMPDGYPNLFIGTIGLIGFLLYFFIRKIPLRERITAFFISTFLVLSMCYEPLELLWHGGQFPIWYPYRFSYVVSFWMLVLSARAMSRIHRMKLLPALSLVVINAGFGIYIMLNIKKFSFLETDQVLLTLLFGFVGIILLTVKHERAKLIPIVFFCFTALEMGTNAVLTLNPISYLSQDDFNFNRTEIEKDVQAIQNKDNGVYRMEKTFSRTKNDGYQTDYYSGSHFSSTFESTVPTFMGSLGLPAGDGFITYSNGTLFTDALFNMKYYFEDKIVPALPGGTFNNDTMLKVLTNKPDLQTYKQISQDGLTKTYQNQNALSMGFGASADILTLKNISHFPLQKQSNIFNALLGNEGYTPLYMAQNFTDISYQNVKRGKGSDSNLFSKIKSKKDGIITYEFTPFNDSSYYLTLDSSLSDDKVTMTLNGKKINQYDTFRDAVVINLAANATGQRQVLKVTIHDSSLWIQNFDLYQLNSDTFYPGIRQLQTSQWQVKKLAENKFTGKIKIKKANQVMMTSIPYQKGWHVNVDGKSVGYQKAAGALIAIPLTKGPHTVTMTFMPPYLVLGIIVSIIALLIIILIWFFLHRNKPKNRYVTMSQFNLK